VRARGDELRAFTEGIELDQPLASGRKRGPVLPREQRIRVIEPCVARLWLERGQPRERLGRASEFAGAEERDAQVEELRALQAVLGKQAGIDRAGLDFAIHSHERGG
jgi:hypothetical protein